VTDDTPIKSILLATQYLIIPGAIRSLRDASVTLALPVFRDGQLLNNPQAPYWGHYCGDEDTRRKPAYHNGTGWAWPFFSYCEALYQHTKDSETSLAILMSAKQEMEKGTINHMPEVCDGNAPHQQRGCGAQAWSITEFYRVFKTIKQPFS
jgi:starch synthase (maltosyl-transferring)